MLTLYEPYGVHSGYQIGIDEVPAPQAQAVLSNVARLLRARNERRAADLLESVPFHIVSAEDTAGWTFSVLYATLPLAEYERQRRVVSEAEGSNAYRRVAGVLAELGTPVRFIAVELAMDTPADVHRAALALKPLEIRRLVQNWIGVASGYLGDFSYASHEAFYVDLKLPIDPSRYEGTTRARFSQILEESRPDVQATILGGVLQKYPIGSDVPSGSGATRTPEFAAEIQGWIARLRGTAPVLAPALLAVTSAVVERALSDAEELLRTNGPTSCVDRVHTALHGYLLDVCRASGLTVTDDSSLTSLLKLLREGHTAFTRLGPRPNDVMVVLRALATIVDKLNPLRNNTSVAHPNTDLLPPEEAMLVVNVVRTLLHYLDAKLTDRA